MLNSISNKPKVYKQRRLGGCSTCHPERQYVSALPWAGRNPHLGVRRFNTWGEAVKWACQPLIMMNGPLI